MKKKEGIIMKMKKDNIESKGQMEKYEDIKERIVEERGKEIIGIDDDY